MVGSCARVTVAPAAQPLAPNPSNVLTSRPMPTQSGDKRSKQSFATAKAPNGDKVCDSSTYSYEEVVGLSTVNSDACGSYQVGGTSGLAVPAF